MNVRWYSTLSRVTAIILAAPWVLPAGTFTAFGPEKYVRVQGTPAPVTKKFTIRDPSAPYTLRIDNAGSFGASVTLNGKEIVSEGEFRSHDIVITKPVTLLAANELIVLQRGQPGETFTLRITGIDNVPPVITITSPAEGATVRTPTLVIAGTVTDQTSGVASLTCNGLAGVVEEPKFTCSVPLQRGPNTITVRAVDFAGNASTKILNVRLILVSITDFDPKSAPAGTLITVTGTDLAPPPGPAAKVTLNKQGGGTIEAPVASASSTTLTFVIPTGAATGPITIMVNGETAVSSVPLTIVPASSFTITALPASADLIQGQSVNYAVRLDSANGFAQLAALSVSGVPTGVTSKFTPTSITAGQTSLLTLTAPSAQPLGSANLTVAASATVDGFPVSQSAGVQLNVVAPTTAFMGRIAVDDTLQTPLAGVTVRMLGKDGNGGNTGCSGTTVSDAAGNFALRNLPATCAGRQLVGYDGLTATSPPGKYAGVNIVYTLTLGQVTVSPVVVHLPRIDDKETFNVQQNSPVDQTYAYKSIPGLSVTVYRGTTFTMPDNTQPNPFPLVAVQVPVDRLPDYKPPVPTMLLVFIVAFQPANARASQPVAVYYPNTINTKPGVSMTMMTLDPTRGQMVPYGTGVVSPDGRQIVPDLDPAYPGKRYGIVNFDWHGPMPPPPPEDNPDDPPPPSCSPVDDSSCMECPPACGSNPVDLSSGIEVVTATDIAINGPRGGISIVRTYRTLTAAAGPFGIGTNHNYGYTLQSVNPQTAQLITLIMPDGSKLPFSRPTPAGPLTNQTAPGMLGAVMTVFPDSRADIRWKAGTTYRFAPPIGGLLLLESITDSNGNWITLTRNEARPVQITRITDPVGHSLILAYDAADRIASITDPIGRTVQYTYNAQGTLATVTDPEGGVTRYEYNAQNRIIRETDPRGVVIAQNTYDANGRIVRQVQADGGIWQFSYTLVNPTTPASPIIQTVVTDPLGDHTTYRFDPTGFFTGATDSANQTRAALRAPGTNQLLAYQGRGSCSSCGAASAGDQSFDYDPSGNGNLLSQTDALGNTTRYTYDPIFNKVTSITDPLGNVTRFTYDSRGNLLTRTDPNGSTATFQYDALGQLIQTTDPIGQKTTFAYDTFGNLISTTDALGNTTRFRYDAIGRLIETLDGLGRRTSTTYDRLGRVLTQIDAKGGGTRFTYDGVGNLLTVTDARNNTTTFTYDAMNRLKTRTTPLGKTDTRTYDFNGNLVQFADRRGQTSALIYDSLNRLVTETYQDATVTRSYDSAGRLIRVDDSAGGVFTFSHDLAGRLLSSASPQGTIQYAYDAAGRVQSRQVMGQVPVAYTYDPAGNLVSASTAQASATFNYDPRNALRTLSRANGVSTSYTYDPAGRILSITHSLGATVLSTQTYTNNATGSRASQTTNIAQPLITQAAVGQYDAGSRQLSFGSTTNTFDHNGNLTSEVGPSGTTTYAWDSRNRLKSITTSTGQTTTFTYDFAGNLITRKDSGPTLNRAQNFVLDDFTNVAHQSDSDGSRLSILSGRSMDQHLAVIQSSGVLYGLSDAINSTVATVDETGAIKTRLFYEPFGATKQTGGDASFPFHFTGRFHDNTIGLYYYRTRYYAPLYARFISEDRLWFGHDIVNLYRYVLNSPLMFTDPTGQFAWFALLIRISVFAPDLLIAGSCGCLKGFAADPNTIDRLPTSPNSYAISKLAEYLCRTLRGLSVWGWQRIIAFVDWLQRDSGPIELWYEDPFTGGRIRVFP